MILTKILPKSDTHYMKVIFQIDSTNKRNTINICFGMLTDETNKLTYSVKKIRQRIENCSATN